MNTNGEIVSRFALLAVMIATLVPLPARGQFVPGRIFTAGGSDTHCQIYRDGFVYETDPENGTYRLFASLPPDSCPGLSSIAMSPDGKHLRVAARNWGAIVEFGAQGNWEVVIDGSDGVFPAANWNSITYDREGNFYLSNYYTLNEMVVKFPADGGPKQVLAYYDNNGVILYSPYSLSVGPSGEVYVAADYNKVFLIGSDGVVSLFDTIDETPLSEFIYSVLVDDAGYVHAQTGDIWHRYTLGVPNSRVVLADCEDICGSQALVLSPDRTRIYTSNYYDKSPWRLDMIAVDPHDGSYETVLEYGGTGSFAIVPLRGDVDGDGNTDLYDLDWFAACMEGAGIEIPAHCHLADMDADGDGDLFDLRYFMLGHSAYTGNN